MCFKKKLGHFMTGDKQSQNWNVLPGEILMCDNPVNLQKE